VSRPRRLPLIVSLGAGPGPDAQIPGPDTNPDGPNGSVPGREDTVTASDDDINGHPHLG
jgi:hypothetical protein